MKKVPLLLLISMLFLCMKCEDYLAPEGMESSVYGRVYDSINDIPVTGLKIKIAESNRKGFYGTAAFIQFLDSTYTDAYGNYLLDYKTSGKGDIYFLVTERPSNIWSVYQDAYELEPSEEVTEKNLNYIHLYPAVLNIRVHPEVSHLPLGIAPPFGHSPGLILKKTDTVYQQKIFIDKNRPQVVRFFRNISLNNSESYKYIIPTTHTTMETVYDITIRERDFASF